MIDPPQPEAVAAVAACHRAGIQVKKITGDHAGTAVAIGRQLGLVR
jgi:P-type E1-E2 ATPase